MKYGNRLFEFTRTFTRNGMPITDTGSCAWFCENCEEGHDNENNIINCKECGEEICISCIEGHNIIKHNKGSEKLKKMYYETIDKLKKECSATSFSFAFRCDNILRAGYYKEKEGIIYFKNVCYSPGEDWN